MGGWVAGLVGGEQQQASGTQGSSGRRREAASSLQRGLSLHLPLQPPTLPLLCIAGSVLRQLADACGAYLPAAAREALLAAARREKFHGVELGDSTAALEAELEKNPLQAAAHEASEL